MDHTNLRTPEELHTTISEIATNMTSNEVKPQTHSFQDLHTTLLRAENQFRSACDQIVLINVKLRANSVRYKRAKATNMKSFRYPLRLRLAVVEGVRNMYYDYALQKAQEIGRLRRFISEFVSQVITIESNDEM